MAFPSLDHRLLHHSATIEQTSKAGNLEWAAGMDMRELRMAT